MGETPLWDSSSKLKAWLVRFWLHHYDGTPVVVDWRTRILLNYLDLGPKDGSQTWEISKI